ncbi:unnamed protein product, partial [Ostreobium quekettii]
FTELSRDAESMTPFLPGAALPKGTGHFYFRAFAFFSSPFRSLSRHDVIVNSGEIVAVAPSADRCGAELVGYLSPTECTDPAAPIKGAICIGLRDGVPEAFFGKRSFLAPQPHCVKLPYQRKEIEQLACHKATLSVASPVLLTSDGPFTNRDSIEVIAQFSFDDVIVSRQTFDVYGPPGASLNSVTPASVDRTYYLDVGLHYPHGVTKMCVNEAYLKGRRMYPVNCIIINKADAQALPVLVQDFAIQPLVPTTATLPEYPVAPYKTGIHDSDRSGEGYEYASARASTMDGQEQIERRGKEKITTVALLAGSIHDFLTPESASRHAIQDISYRQALVTAPGVTSVAPLSRYEETTAGVLESTAPWLKLQRTSMEGAFRRLAGAVDSSEPFPAALRRLGFVLSDDVIPGSIDGLLSCIGYSMTGKSDVLNGVALAACPELPDFLRPAVSRYLYEQPHALVHAMGLLPEVLPSEHGARALVGDKSSYGTITDLFRGFCSDTDPRTCLRHHGFVFHGGRVAKASPVWAQIIPCLSKSAVVEGGEIKYHRGGLFHCRLRFLPKQLLSAGGGSPLMTADDIRELILGTTRVGEVAVTSEDEPAGSGAHRHVLGALADTICAGEDGDYVQRCLKDHGFEFSENRAIILPRVYEDLMACLMTSVVEQQGEEEGHVYYLRLHKLLSCPMPRQFLKAIEPHQIVDLAFSYAMLGSALEGEALKTADGVWRAYKEDANLQNAVEALHQRHSMDLNAGRYKQQQPRNLLHTIYHFMNDLVPLRLLLEDMLVQSGHCSVDAASTQSAAIYESVFVKADRRSRNPLSLGLQFRDGHHKSLRSCTRGWGPTTECLASSIADKAHGQAPGHTSLAHIDSAKACTCGIFPIKTCRNLKENDRIMPLENVATLVGVETLRLDTIEELTREDAVRIVQQLVAPLSEACQERDANGVPTCLRALGCEFGQDAHGGRHPHNGPAPSGEALVACQDWWFAVVDALQESQQPLGYEAHVLVGALARHPHVQPYEKELTAILTSRSGLEGSGTTTSDNVRTLLPTLRCLLQCDLGRVCLGMEGFAGYLEDDQYLKQHGVTLEFLMLSCQPVSFFTLAQGVDGYRRAVLDHADETRMHPAQAASLGLSRYEGQVLSRCLADMGMPQKSVLMCGLGAISHGVHGHEVQLSKLPLLACLACSAQHSADPHVDLNKEIGGGRTFGTARNLLHNGGMGSIRAVSSYFGGLDHTLQGYLMAMVDTDPWTHHAAATDNVRFMVEVLNLLFHEVELLPHGTATEGSYKNVLEMVMPFVAAVHKTTGGDSEADLTVAFATALAATDKSLRALQEYRKEAGVSLGNAVGQALKPCMHAGVCKPDTQFLVHNYLPGLKAVHEALESSSEIHDAIVGIITALNLPLASVDQGMFSGHIGSAFDHIVSAVGKIVGEADAV